MSWTPRDIPDQSGKTIVITGANSGIGFEATKLLADKGAHVIMACRSQARAETAREQILQAVPGATLTLKTLDLSDLQSIRDFAATLHSEFTSLDVLLNNAGVMAPPLTRTREGFELQIGTNHLGHFALTGLLLDLLSAAPAGRVVTVSSIAHRMGTIRFEDMQWQKKYSRWLAYGQSKLANLVFARDLQRRLQRDGSGVISVAVHPGYSATHLQDTMPGGKMFNALFAQHQSQGALPSVFAATAAQASPGGYYGPNGWMELRGQPGPARPRKLADNHDVAQRLWQVSEQLTGVRYLSTPAAA